MQIVVLRMNPCVVILSWVVDRRCCVLASCGFGDFGVVEYASILLFSLVVQEVWGVLVAEQPALCFEIVVKEKRFLLVVDVHSIGGS